MSCRLTIATTVVLAGLSVTACSDPAGGDLPETAGSSASTSSQSNESRTDPAASTASDDGSVATTTSARAQDGQTRGASSMTDATGVRLVRFREPTPISDREVEGTLVLRQGCIVFLPTGDSSAYTAVFPAGATLRQDGASGPIVTIDGRRLPLGERAVFSGGRLTEQAAGGVRNYGMAECPNGYFGISGVRI